MRLSSCFIHLSALYVFIFLFSVFEHAVLAIPIDNTNFIKTINATASMYEFHQDEKCPRIVSREEWNARDHLNFEIMPIRPVPYVVVHHGGIPKYCQDQESCSKLVKDYQDLHLDERGWWDIGYNFIIGEDGNVYKGRGWHYTGAHAIGYNTQSIGICIIGDFSDFLPNEAALKALKKLIDCGVSLGKIRNNYNVIGHRQVRDTVCPGENSPNIISRAEWGALPPKSQSNLKLKPAPYVIIHHSVGSGCETQAICQLKVREFQRYHINNRGWTDIGYNFLVGEDGNVYEGRGWGKKGAHSKPFNSKSIGICIIGDYRNRTPKAAAVQAATNLIAYGVENGEIKSDYKLLGHRQTWPTECPGDSLYTMIKSWPHWSENQ
ncbi:Peptidoglycan recognition protein 3 [Cyphomyrmex costatus]|uniref:Peptidoglycan recognition protein 3 n=1 Tax=Cyphomyrmex costatus TaxID=456900 RepID=A0A195CU81_9HYME|nr:Peptidoglycan recognition protein 3 [Cyphomyrmex costatus]